MIIEKAIIEGYIPLLNNGVKYLEWSPQSGMTGVLGSNGSGKSSLMRILSPLAGDRSLFVNGGSVCINYRKDNERYVVGFEVANNKLVHHFYRGDELEELNRGGTGKEQDDLAAEIFGYTKTIHQCLTGKIKFSLLGPSKRATLLQDVVDIDVSEGEKVYESLRSSYRDLQGSHNHVSSKIIMHQNGVLSEEAIETNQRIIEQCINGIEYLRSKAKPRPSVELTTLNKRYSDLIQRLGGLSEAVRLAPNLDAFDYRDQNLVELNNTLTTEAGIKKQRIEDWSREYFELEKSLSEGDINHTQLKHDTEALNKARLDEIYALGEVVVLEDVEAEGHAVMLQLATTFQSFVTHAITLRDTSNLNIENTSSVYRTNLTNRISILQNDINTLVNRKSNGEQWLVRVKTTDKEECPKCKHQYWKDFDPKDVERISATLDELTVKEPILRAELEALQLESLSIEAFCKEISTVITEMMKLPDCIRVMYQPLFVTEDFSYPVNLFNRHVLMSEVNQVTEGINKAATKQRLLLEVEADSKLIKKLESLIDGNVYDKLSKRSFELNTMITNNTEEVKDLDREIMLLQKYIAARESFVNWGKEIDMCLEELLLVTEQMFDWYDYDCNETTYRALQGTLAYASEIISNNTSNRDMLNEAEKDLAIISTEMKKLEVLIKTISPQTGLIAYELTNGINQFTSMMNDMLSEMWEYSMVIAPCDLEKGKLTYRFPVSIKSGTPIKDIVEGSDGQRQIVDFIFSMLYIRQKGLREFPLILDEPATGLDHKHLSTFFSYVKRLANEKFCSQIFLISHVFGIMGDFTELDLIVLDEDNVGGLTGITYNTNLCLC